MDKLFYPDSIAIIGLSSKPNNIPRLVLENLIRWGYRGRIFGVNPTSEDQHVNGIKMYKSLSDLPVVPDLAFALIPARYVPATIDECGKVGIKWMAIPSGGFNELGGDGAKIADAAVQAAGKYGIRFVGPNGVTVANTANGLCLPFVPSYSPPRGHMSVISQSGGVGLMMWNLMTDEKVGMAKFASIGNKLNMDEVDFLEYFGRDPETKYICMYLESIPRGDDFLRVASQIDKPIIVLKSNTTEAGHKTAMSHTAAVSNDEDIIDSAFERAGIIRIKAFSDFIAVVKAFSMPPMKDKRIMVMSPAGGFTVMMADLCEREGFEFADPGKEFYESLQQFSNAGVINFSNPLDMGDIYDAGMYPHIFYNIMHNEHVDGAVYVGQWPHMPKGDDVFYRMFHTDLSKEATGTLLSSGKPMGICLYGLAATITRIKQNMEIPIFNSPEEMVRALRKQHDYYQTKKEGPLELKEPAGIDKKSGADWIAGREGDIGEEAMELLDYYGISAAPSGAANSAKDAAALGKKFGFPVVMKVVSPDALHKSDAGGVILNIAGEAAAEQAFNDIERNLAAYKKGARFDGVRVMKQAGEGYDMFIGGKMDDSFGPVVFFGYGGIYIEVFHDVENVLCPSNRKEIEKHLKRLRTCKIISGIRGRGPGDIAGYADMIERVSYLLADHPEIKELDLNPVRILGDGSGVLALDARMRIARG